MLEATRFREEYFEVFKVDESGMKKILEKIRREIKGYQLVLEVFSAFNRAKEKINYEKVVDYAIRFETTALIQRFGFLMDFLKAPISKKLRQRLLNKAQEGQAIPLAASGRFGRGGNLFKEWNIIQNIPDDILHSN